MNIFYTYVDGCNAVQGDTWRLIKQIGGQIDVRKNVKRQNVFASLARNLNLVYGLFTFGLRRFKRTDQLFVLLPWTMPFKSLYYRILLSKKADYNIIMVDLDCVRTAEYDESQEKQICLKAKSILCQTERMKKAMLEQRLHNRKL